MSTEKFTLVTALLDIGRDSWDVEWLRRSTSKYLEYLEKMSLRMKAPLYIFAEKEFIPFIREKRGNRPLHVEEVYKRDLRLFSKLNRIRAIQASEEYRSHGVSGCPEVDKPEYDLVVNNKVEFVYRASLDNPFGTKRFVWIDAGYGHGKIEVPEDFEFQPRFEEKKVCINTLMAEMGDADPLTFFKAHVDFIDGGLWTTDVTALRELHSRYYQIIEEVMQKNLIDDDQYFMTLVSARYPELFSLYNNQSWENRRLALGL
jgi:protein YibB